MNGGVIAVVVLAAGAGWWLGARNAAAPEPRPAVVFRAVPDPATDRAYRELVKRVLERFQP